MTGSCCMKIRRDAGKRQPFTSCSEDHEVAVTVLQQCWWNVLTVFVFQGPLGHWLSEIAAMVRFPSLLRNVVKLVFIDLWDGDRAPWYSTCPACTAPYMFNSSSPRWPVYNAEPRKRSPSITDPNPQSPKVFVHQHNTLPISDFEVVQIVDFQWKIYICRHSNRHWDLKHFWPQHFR